MRMLLNGKPTTTKAIKVELGKATKDALDNAELAVVERLQRLINNLVRRSASRTGLGRSNKYSNRNPMANAKIVVKREGDKRIIYVDNYVFNLLDQGRKPNSAKSGAARAKKRGGRPFRFRRYIGRLTRPNSARLSRSGVDVSEDEWVSTRSVKGFEPRNFYQEILKELKIKRRKKTSIFTLDVELDSGVVDFEVRSL